MKVDSKSLPSLPQVQQPVNSRQCTHLKLLVNRTPQPSLFPHVGPYESDLREELGHRQRDHGLGKRVSRESGVAYIPDENVPAGVDVADRHDEAIDVKMDAELEKVRTVPDENAERMVPDIGL